MTKKLFSFFFIFFIFFSTNSLNAQDNIAFIDLNVVFDNSNAGKKISKEIQNQRKKNNDNFNKLKKKFEIDKEKLITQKNVLSTEEFEKKILKLEKDMNEYNSEIKKKNSELTKFQLNVRKEFYKSLRPILEEYAKSNSIDIILKKDNVLIGKTNLDISQNILNLYNKKVKKISIN